MPRSLAVEETRHPSHHHHRSSPARAAVSPQDAPWNAMIHAPWHNNPAFVPSTAQTTKTFTASRPTMISETSCLGPGPLHSTTPPPPLIDSCRPSPSAHRWLPSPGTNRAGTTGKPWLPSALWKARHPGTNSLAVVVVVVVVVDIEASLSEPCQSRYRAKMNSTKSRPLGNLSWPRSSSPISTPPPAPLMHTLYQRSERGPR